jgi:hypothetical protein
MRSPTDAHWRVSNLARYRGESHGIEIFHSRVAMCAARSPRSRRDRQYLHYRSRRWRAHSRVWRSGWCKDVPPPQRSQTTRRSYQPRLRMRAPDSKTRLTLTCAMSVLCHALARNPSPGRVAALGARVRIRAHAARWLNSTGSGPLRHCVRPSAIDPQQTLLRWIAEGTGHTVPSIILSPA